MSLVRSGAPFDFLVPALPRTFVGGGIHSDPSEIGGVADVLVVIIANAHGIVRSETKYAPLFNNRCVPHSYNS